MLNADRDMTIQGPNDQVNFLKMSLFVTFFKLNELDNLIFSKYSSIE